MNGKAGGSRIAVAIEFSAALDVRGRRSGDSIGLESGSTLADALASLGIQPDHQAHVRGFINGRPATPAAVLRDGDRLYLMVPAGGG